MSGKSSSGEGLRPRAGELRWFRDLRRACRWWICAGVALAAHGLGASLQKPNIIFILADDLGYGDLGCYGQRIIKTPHLDRLGAEGIRFTQFYAGSTVCAPSRSVLMTGQHVGHTRIRGNGPGLSLSRDDVTVAKVLRDAGYATGLIGKWGLGDDGTDGEPQKQGFDYFFGFLGHGHAHNHYPDFLWRNGRKVALRNVVTPLGSVGAGYATKRVEYANDLFFDDAGRFLERHRSGPFFLYLALTIPHANNERARALGDGQEVPDYGEYAHEPWAPQFKGQAAMISRMDRQVGELMTRLKSLGLDDTTLVIFSSDNGPHQEGGGEYDPGFFDANGPLRGIKRSLAEGGIRVPFIARWPGRIAPGRVSGEVGYFGDFLATCADLASVTLPESVAHDGVSLVPTLRGSGGQRRHEYLYWEHYGREVIQAVLLEGRWKGIRHGNTTAPIALFDLDVDPAEQSDLAARHPAIVARIAATMGTAHVPNERWRIDPAGPVR